MTDFTAFTDAAEKMKQFVPEVKFNKSGYEIRTDVLAMAKDHVQNEYRAKYAGWEVSAERDQKTNQIVTKIEMPPYPGMDKVLETAQKMYDFVNQSTTKK